MGQMSWKITRISLLNNINEENKRLKGVDGFLYSPLTISKCKYTIKWALLIVLRERERDHARV